MNRFLFPIILVFVAVLTSCSPVRTITPVVAKTESSLQKEFQGTWKIGEGIFHVAFDKDGLGRFAWIEWKDNQFVTTEGKFNALESKDDDERGFISILLEDEEDVYLFGAFKFIEPDSILLWEAEPFSRYELLMEENDLKGEVDKEARSKRIVFADGAALADKINIWGDYFELDEPVIMTRVIPREEAN